MFVADEDVSAGELLMLIVLLFRLTQFLTSLASVDGIVSGVTVCNVAVRGAASDGVASGYGAAAGDVLIVMQIYLLSRTSFLVSAPCTTSCRW